MDQDILVAIKDWLLNPESIGFIVGYLLLAFSSSVFILDFTPLSTSHLSKGKRFWIAFSIYSIWISIFLWVAYTYIGWTILLFYTSVKLLCCYFGANIGYAVFGKKAVQFIKDKGK
jgi:hypothetical protein